MSTHDDIDFLDSVAGASMDVAATYKEKWGEAEARIEELEAELKRAQERARDERRRYQSQLRMRRELDDRLANVTPPPGHVAVIFSKRELEAAMRIVRRVGAKDPVEVDFAERVLGALEAETVTCDVCGDTVPRGWPCSCDDGRE